MRRGLVIGCAAVLAAGCLGPRGAPVLPNSREIAVPKLDEAAADVAERVERVAQQLIQGTPLGVPEIEVLTVGAAEPELFHRDSHVLYVTDALAKACKTDEQLAALLARDMAAMTVEHRRALDRQAPRPAPAVASAPKLDGTTDFDPARDAQLAKLRTTPRDLPRPREDYDVPAVAATLLRQAGFRPESLKETAELQALAAKGGTLAKQMGGGGAVPRWSK